MPVTPSHFNCLKPFEIPCKIQHALDRICLLMNRKHHCLLLCVETKGLLKVKAVTYTIKVVIYHKSRHVTINK